MIDFSEVTKRLNAAPTRTSNINMALMRISQLRPVLAYALQDAKDQKVPEAPEVVPTSEQQAETNAPLTEEVSISQDDLDALRLEAEEELKQITVNAEKVVVKEESKKADKADQKKS